jgi:hypothetical protein
VKAPKRVSTGAGSGFAAGALRGTDRPWQPALLLPVVWALIVWRRHVTRKAFVDSIAWVTRDGLSVIPGDARTGWPRAEATSIRSWTRWSTSGASASLTSTTFGARG